MIRFINCQAITMDPAQPRVDSFAIENQRFFAVGRPRIMAGYAPGETAVIDLKGRTVIPGLIESHNHTSLYA